MVAAWLKGFLIERFFELLSHDGHTDRRRPEYWMRYRSSIDNIWFILGATAMRNWNEDFRKLRQTMGNQSLSLDGSTANNNAFAMKIGDLFVVEFGQKGHATFFFDKNTLPFDLAQRALPLFQLKSPKHVNRLTHLDGRESWETRFSEAMAGYGVYPDKRPFGGPESRHQNTAPSGGSAAVESPFNPRLLKKFCNERGLRYSDDTRRGRFIVFTDTSNNFVSRQLSLWGFAYDREDSEWIISL